MCTFTCSSAYDLFIALYPKIHLMRKPLFSTALRALLPTPLICCVHTQTPLVAHDLSFAGFNASLPDRDDYPFVLWPVSTAPKMRNNSSLPLSTYII
jgi:hypothetical protein